MAWPQYKYLFGIVQYCIKWLGLKLSKLYILILLKDYIVTIHIILIIIMFKKRLLSHNILYRYDVIT